MIQTQIELDQPFRIDAQGRVAFTSDPSRVLENRVRMVIGTQIGERVMRPLYGTPVISMLFDGDDDLTASVIMADIVRALAEYEPGVVVQNVYLDSGDNQLDGVVNVNVIYSAANSPLQNLTIPVNTALLHRGGTIEEERSG